MQRAGQTDVVNVMTGNIRQRPFLTPTGHAAIDETWIYLKTICRTQSEAFHYTGTKSLKNDVGRACKTKRDCNSSRVFQIKRNRTTPPVENIVACSPAALICPVIACCWPMTAVRPFWALETNRNEAVRTITAVNSIG